MGSRWATGLLLLLLALVQAQVWWGRGSLPAVRDLREQVQTQQHANQEAEGRNQQLDTELKDLRSGLGLVEEKARAELGMVKPNEVFIQITR